MPYKPTGKPVGRPRTKDYTTFSIKIPRELLTRAKTYAAMHNKPLAEVIRAGLEWSISGNTEIPYISNGTSIPAATMVEDPAPPVVEPVAPEVPYFDPVKHRLGRLCPRGHAWGNTGQSLRRNNLAGVCLRCDAEAAKERRQEKRQAVTAPKRRTRKPVSARTAAR